MAEAGEQLSLVDRCWSPVYSVVDCAHGHRYGNKSACGSRFRGVCAVCHEAAVKKVRGVISGGGGMEHSNYWVLLVTLPGGDDDWSEGENIARSLSMWYDCRTWFNNHFRRDLRLKSMAFFWVAELQHRETGDALHWHIVLRLPCSFDPEVEEAPAWMYPDRVVDPDKPITLYKPMQDAPASKDPS